MVSVHDVLEIVQCTLVKLGNANTLLTTARLYSILQVVNRSLVKYSKDYTPISDSHYSERTSPLPGKNSARQIFVTDHHYCMMSPPV